MQLGRVSCFPHLNWSRTQGKDLITSPLGVAVHVDKDVNAVLVDAVGSLTIAGDL